MRKCFLYIFVIFLTGFLRVWELWESHCLKFPPYVFVPESLLFLFCVCLLSQTTNQCIKHWRGKKKKRSESTITRAGFFGSGVWTIHLLPDRHWWNRVFPGSCRVWPAPSARRYGTSCSASGTCTPSSCRQGGHSHHSGREVKRKKFLRWNVNNLEQSTAATKV